MLKRIKNENDVTFAVQRQKIKSWDRLLKLAHEHSYRGRSLDDSTPIGLIECMQVWLMFNEMKYIQAGPLFTLSDNINIEVSHTLGLSEQQQRLRETILNQAGEYHLVTDFNDFLRIWDKHF